MSPHDSLESTRNLGATLLAEPCTYPRGRLASVDCEYGADRGEAVDVVGPVEGVEADDEAALPLALHLDHVVHLLGHQQACRPGAPVDRMRHISRLLEKHVRCVNAFTSYSCSAASLQQHLFAWGPSG